MKRILLIIAPLFVGNPLAGDTAGTVSFTDLDYVSTVFLQGGTGPGQNDFGVTCPSEGEGLCVGPNAMALDRNQNLCILDPANMRIKKYTRKGELERSIQLKSLREICRLDDPSNNYLAVDASQTIFIATRITGSDAALVVAIGRNDKIESAFIGLDDYMTIGNADDTRVKGAFEKLKSMCTIEVIPIEVGAIRKLFQDLGGAVFIRTTRNALVDPGNKLKAHPFAGSPLRNGKYTYTTKGDPVSEIVLQPVRGKKATTIPVTLPADRLAEGWALSGAEIADDDDKGNLFIAVTAAKSEGGKNRYSNASHELVYHYLNDKPVGIITIPVMEGEYRVPLLYGREGEIYQLVWNHADPAAGVKVLKWTKKN